MYKMLENFRNKSVYFSFI